MRLLLLLCLVVPIVEKQPMVLLYGFLGPLVILVITTKNFTKVYKHFQQMWKGMQETTHF
jgi:hypothetical protein